MTVEHMPQPNAEKSNLRSLVSELTERMVRALDTPEGLPPEQGKETATFTNLRDALSTVCSVYKLLEGIGDFDDSGSALAEYGKVLRNGRTNQNRR